ncbi:NUDIX domain-containing protein [Streptomyces sp. NRRL F-5630]|uniref:NUDIX domain-containing protein n=1 Tax=Streptomyces sp. NRRL F-5630 TaxID=1463864 RepID=UPI003D71538C
MTAPLASPVPPLAAQRTARLPWAAARPAPRRPGEGERVCLLSADGDEPPEGFAAEALTHRSPEAGPGSGPWDGIVVPEPTTDVPSAAWAAALRPGGWLLTRQRLRGRTYELCWTLRADGTLRADEVRALPDREAVPLVPGERAACTADGLVRLVRDADQPPAGSGIAAGLAPCEQVVWTCATLRDTTGLDALALRLAATDSRACALSLLGTAPGLLVPAGPATTPALATGDSLAYLVVRPEESGGDGAWQAGAAWTGPGGSRLAAALEKALREGACDADVSWSAHVTGAGRLVVSAGSLRRYLAEHAAPAGCADLLIRDAHGRVLLVEPTYKDGWDLPGGMLEDEEPAHAAVREVREELGIDVFAGRLLVEDTVPRGRWGRSIVARIYAGHPPHEVRTEALRLEPGEIAAAEFVSEEEALRRVPEELAKRLSAAFVAERDGELAELHDGVPRTTPDERLAAQARGARLALAERLAGRGLLDGDRLREVFVATPVELLLPQVYAPRPGPRGHDGMLQLIDCQVPRERGEWLALVHGEAPLVVRYGDERLCERPAGRVVPADGPLGLAASPYLGLVLLQHLGAQARSTVLEYGTGTTTALLCALSGRVHAVEPDPLLAAGAHEGLTALGLRAGVTSCAPPDLHWDRVLVSRLATGLPAGAPERLSPGGVLVAALLAPGTAWPAVAVLRRPRDGGDCAGTLLPLPRVAAVPGPRGPAPGLRLAAAHLLREGEGVTGRRALLERWEAAGGPDTYALRATAEGQLTVGAPGSPLSWEIPPTTG